MRTRVLAVLAVLTGLALVAGLLNVPASRAEADGPGDWTIARFQAGPDGAYIRYGWSAQGRRVGSDPLVLGTVQRQSNQLTGADVYEPMTFEVPTDGMTVRTSNEAGALNVEAIPNSKGLYAFSQGRVIILDPNESATLVSFVGGATATTVGFNWILDLGSVTVTSSRGSGTQLLRPVDRTHSGMAVEAGYVGAGRTSQTRNLPAGIVGGLVRTCEGCNVAWSAPDGRSGAAESRGVSAQGIYLRQRNGGTHFAGPAGSWTWTFEGVDGDPTASTQVLGAYVPVGAAHSEFIDVGDFGGPSKDWALATVTAGPGGAAAPSVDVTGTVVRPPGGEVVIGVGRSAPGDSYIVTDALGDTGMSARTSDGLGALDVRVVATSASEGALTATWYPGPLGPNETRTMLVFAAGGVLAYGAVDATTEGGSLAVTRITQGNGSTVIRAAGPQRGGTVVDVGRAQAGAGGDARRTVTTGIAGGLGYQCDRCTTGWSSPDGRNGSWTHEINGTGSGVYSFGGPAGAWRWTWEGLDVEADGGAGLIGGYAPIGADWSLFA